MQRLVVSGAVRHIYIYIYMSLGGKELWTVAPCHTLNVGPCHHGMARPQVADGGTASNMKGSCE
jgi:hypothetical protein